MKVDPKDPSEIITEAVRLYLQNKRNEAIELLSVQSYVEANGGKFVETTDASSVLKGFIACVGLLEGMLSGSADMLVVILEELWETERLANNSPDKEWIGNRVSRGMSYMLGGILQVFMGRYVKGGMNVAIAFKLIKDFEEDVLSIPADGEEGYIRSLGLLVLSLLNFFARIVPASISSAGEYLGFGISKEKFREYIDMCGRENGAFSAIAKLVLVQTAINSKNFVFDKISPEEISQCRSLLNECLIMGPESVIVRVINASVCLGEGNLIGAGETLSNEDISSVISRPEWTNMELAVGYKLGVVYLCDFEFLKASAAFKRAADAIEKTGRWHYVPFMRNLQGLSHLAAASMGTQKNWSQIRRESIEIFSSTLEQRDVSKDAVVLPGDHWGARVGYERAVLLNEFTDEEFERFITAKGPVFDVLFALLTVLYHFEKINSEKLGHFMKDFKTFKTLPKTGLDQTDFKTGAVLGEYYRKIGAYDKSVSAFDDAIQEIDTAVEERGWEDKDSVLGFCLVLQGAALTAAGDVDTAREVLADLNDVLTESQDSAIGSLVESLSSSLIKNPIESKRLVPSNLVKPRGGEFDLMLSFRKNGLKRKMADPSH